MSTLVIYVPSGWAGLRDIIRPYSRDEELPEIARWCRDNTLPMFVLAGGSNVIIADNGFPGLVISPRSQKIEIIQDLAETRQLRVGAGVSWDYLVRYALSKGLRGLEC